jgi:hypothetical protein
VIGIDLVLAASPILILNLEINQLNNNWYFTIICLAAASCVDPFLCLLFSPHKISAARRKFLVFKMMSSFFIVILSIILPMQPSRNGLSLEQSNDLMFIVFSVFCFCKSVTVVDELLLRNRVIAKVTILIKQLWPFFVRTFAFYLLAALFYFLLGQILFGGKINSSSVYKYQHDTGMQLRPNYKYFHFNDTPSSLLTLLVLLLQNNWLLVAEQLFSVNQSITTALFLISYNFFVVFVLTALVLGITSKLIITYFDEDFTMNKESEKAEKSQSEDNRSLVSNESEKPQSIY